MLRTWQFLLDLLRSKIKVLQFIPSLPKASILISKAANALPCAIATLSRNAHSYAHKPMGSSSRIWPNFLSPADAIFGEAANCSGPIKLSRLIVCFANWVWCWALQFPRILRFLYQSAERPIYQLIFKHYYSSYYRWTTRLFDIATAISLSFKIAKSSLFLCINAYSRNSVQTLDTYTSLNNYLP